MHLIATGKWSKEEKRWKMVVALRPPGRRPEGSRAGLPLRGSSDAAEASRPRGPSRRPQDS